MWVVFVLFAKTIANNNLSHSNNVTERVIKDRILHLVHNSSALYSEILRFKSWARDRMFSLL
jgi:hypothetical protein